MWIEMTKETAEYAAKALRKAGETTAAERIEHYLEIENDPRTTRFRLLAEKYAKDGEIEFDEACTVSIGDDAPTGAYVMAWIWVHDEDLSGWQGEVVSGQTILGFMDWLKKREDEKPSAPEPSYTRNAHPSVGGETE